MKIKEKGKKILERIKREKYIIGACIIGLAGYAAMKSLKGEDEYGPYFKSEDFMKSIEENVTTEEQAKAARKIDEDVFTELAPEIEGAVLHPGIDNTHIERIYSLGKDHIKKKVTVDVKSISGSYPWEES